MYPILSLDAACVLWPTRDVNADETKFKPIHTDHQYELF